MNQFIVPANIISDYKKAQKLSLQELSLPRHQTKSKLVIL